MTSIPTVNEAYYPTFEEGVGNYLRVIKYGLGSLGLKPNVLPGGEYWYRARAVVALVQPAFANNKLAIADTNPNTAKGQKLIEFAASYGITKRPSSPAAGFVKIAITGTGVITIPKGYQCTGADGIKYVTTGLNTCDPSSLSSLTIAVTATIGGVATNKSAGDIVTWDSATIGPLKRNATVAPGGIKNGIEEDTEEVLRSRLLNRMSSPGYGGNWAFAKALAESSSAAIDAVYVYSSIQGPSSHGLVAVAADGDRTVSSTIVSAMAAAVVAGMPGWSKLNATTVTPQYVDTILKAQLPLPTIAGGKGGGWRDAAPWPNAASGNVKVTAYSTVGGVLTATTDATALNGLKIGTRIGNWDPVAQVMREYTVSSAVLSGGFYQVQVVAGFGNDPTGSYLSAGAERLVDYAKAAAAGFLSIGPGEKSSDTNVVPRALRKPAPDAGNAAVVGSLIPAAVTAANPEVISLDFANTYATGTTTPLVSPSVPAVSTDPPNIIVLKHLAIRQA